MLPYQKIITQAIRHIKREQLPDGSFLSLSSIKPEDFSDAVTYKTTFFTSNILIALQALSESSFLSYDAINDLKEIQQKGVAFLLNQKNEQWSFNYFARDAEKPSPYPDDLDDTCMALAAITHYEPNYIDGQALATIIKLLVHCETDPGGPFKTWLVPKDAAQTWQDVDIVVNSNVGYFLSLIDIYLPSIHDSITKKLTDSEPVSPYYPTQTQVLYFVSRFYKSQKERLSDIYISPTLKNPNLLEQAIIISSMEDIRSFIASIENEGFRPYAFCIDPMREGKRSYAGSSALTAALSAEALARHAETYKARTANTVNTFHAHIQNLACERSAKLDPELQKLTLEQIEKTSDKKITLLSYEVQKILQAKGISIPTALVENLALSNLYGWMAYTIHDDIMDDEGESLLIPCANFFLRELIQIYDVLDNSIPGAASLLRNTMNRIDNGMVWEKERCQFPNLPEFGDYSNLADRSIGHALGPVTILLSIGHNMDSEEDKNMMALFHHYLIARQLHDDAHDWEEDLLRGRVNSVCSLLLKQFQKKYHGVQETSKLREFFWTETIDEVVDLILFHINAAEAAKEASLLFGNTDFMKKVLQALSASAKRTLDERNTSLEFIKYYRLQ